MNKIKKAIENSNLSEAELIELIDLLQSKLDAKGKPGPQPFDDGGSTPPPPPPHH